LHGVEDAVLCPKETVLFSPAHSGLFDEIEATVAAVAIEAAAAEPR
jgi:hypothetical protein